MDDDPMQGLGLRSVALTDQALFRGYLDTLKSPLSDYTFSQIFTWGNSLRILWKEIHGHLCIFANGTGDLTLLIPPIGEGGSDRALAGAYEVMDAYNGPKNALDHGRVEYASEELLYRFDGSKLSVIPMGADYVYDVHRMIDLAGGDLASKRQLKNRFLRNYESHVEDFDPRRHLSSCLELLGQWKQMQDQRHVADRPTVALKRQKESLACELALREYEALNLRGLVVYTRPSGSPDEMRLSGFTFGEHLGQDQSSIIIEKTDLQVRGLAQFIFSEFCRRHWSHRPLVNAGDDWGLETLAWTKSSYRPVKMLPKYEFRALRPVSVAMPAPADAPCVRAATESDVNAAVDLEQSCFTAYCLTKRQLRYLQSRPSAVFLVAEDSGQIVGEAIALVRRHKRGKSGRIYSLAVHADHRRRKLGQRLLGEMLRGLQEQGVGRVYLEVEQANTPAVQLYERNGFEKIGLIDDYYGPGRAAVHMVRK